jgi:aspartate racemase
MKRLVDGGVVVLSGTRWLVASEIYPETLTARGLECVRSNAAEIEEINRIIMNELVNSLFTPEAVRCFQRVNEGLALLRRRYFR